MAERGNPKFKTGGNKGGPGRPKGSLNKRSQELYDLVDTLGGKPIHKFVKVLNGDEEGEEHPVKVYIEENDLGPGTMPSEEQWIELCSLIEDSCTPAPPTLDQQMRAAEALMPYLYPKLKAVELSGGLEATLNGLNVIINSEKLKA